MQLYLKSPGAYHLRPGKTFFLQPQEIPLTDPDSSNFFQPSQFKPFVATFAAFDTFGMDLILACLNHLQRRPTALTDLITCKSFRPSMDQKPSGSSRTVLAVSSLRFCPVMISFFT